MHHRRIVSCQLVKIINALSQPPRANMMCGHYTRRLYMMIDASY